MLPSPLRVLDCLGELAGTPGYWAALALSAGRILGGFLTASALAAGLAALSARFSPVRELLSPAVAAIKAVPVASFIILVYLWLPGRWLTTFILSLIHIWAGPGMRRASPPSAPAAPGWRTMPCISRPRSISAGNAGWTGRTRPSGTTRRRRRQPGGRPSPRM